MSTVLQIQIFVYMVVMAAIAFAWGYSKGHKEGVLLGRRHAYKLIGKLASNPFNSDATKWEYNETRRSS